jgi:hypothetical protein
VCGGEGERDCSFDCTVGVRATGEKIAREPDWRRTVIHVLVFGSGDGRGRENQRRGDIILPTVALPPNFILPNRRKGTEKVVTLGERSRMTITSSGFLGMSLSDMMLWCAVRYVVC